MEFSKEQKLYAEIVQKAWEDADFKRELIKDPVNAIEKLIGEKLTLSDDKKIVVKDQTDEATVYINIPAKPNHDDVELTEGQLDMVAGGVGSLNDLVKFVSGFITGGKLS